jgi:hypothetical protein
MRTNNVAISSPPAPSSRPHLLAPTVAIRVRTPIEQHRHPYLWLSLTLRRRARSYPSSPCALIAKRNASAAIYTAQKCHTSDTRPSRDTIHYMQR